MLIFGSNVKNFGEHHGLVAAKINRFLANRLAVMNQPATATVQFHTVTVNQQGNNVDCGLYMLHYFKTFVCHSQVIAFMLFTKTTVQLLTIYHSCLESHSCS
jgi:Ulp1 family protease